MLLMGFGGDQWVVDYLFCFEGSCWVLQDVWIICMVVYKVGKWLSMLVVLVVILLCFYYWCKGCDYILWWVLFYVVIVLVLGIGVIFLLKLLVLMECFWDLLCYGGYQLFIGFFIVCFVGMVVQVCFLVGYVSVGYVWLCFYYFVLLWCLLWCWVGLWIGFGVGLVFGISQQLCGVYFFLYDVVIVLICWLFLFGFYLIVKCVLIYC